MKHFISYTVCTAALLFASCQKLDFNSEGNTDSDRLLFNTSLDGVDVVKDRAAGTDTDLKNYGFYLAGYHTMGLMEANTTEAFPNIFDKDIDDHQPPVPLVEFKDNKFMLKTIKWLLNDVSYLSFFGWSQDKAFATAVDGTTTGIIRHTFKESDKGYPWLEVRNADAPADQTDVVGSRSMNHKNDAVLSAVDLDFRHLLSKLSFKVKSSSKANITFTGVDIVYAASKVRKMARYTFGNDASTIGSYALDDTEFQSGTVPLSTSYPPIVNGVEVALGSTLLLPQELQAGDVSLVIKYKTSPNSGDIAGAEQTTTLPLSAFTFEQGNNYVYVIDIMATSIQITSKPLIEAWSVLSSPLPSIVGPQDGKTLLLLDGYDKPYKHTDGKMYWLDRSGYNRHVKLDPGYKSYDETNHAYAFYDSSFGGAEIPDLGTLNHITVDVVTEAEDPSPTVSHRLFGLMASAAPSSEKYYFDLPSSSSEVLWGFPGNTIKWTLPSVDEMNKQALWTVMYGSAGNAKLYHNATLRGERGAIGAVGAITNGILAKSYPGKISYLKITSAERTPLEIVTDYKTLAKRFNIVENPGIFLPPVTDGLVYCLDGRSGVENINGTRYWRDQVSKNDAKILRSDIVEFLNGNHFYFNAKFSEPSPMQMIYAVPLPNTYTMQVVQKGVSCVVSWRQIPNDSDTRVLDLYYNSTNNNVYCNSPVSDAFAGSWPGGIGNFSDKRQLTVRRNYRNYMQIWSNGGIVFDRGAANADTDISSRVIEDMSIGRNVVGDVYMIRLYDRLLSEEEMTKNWNYDKVNFGL